MVSVPQGARVSDGDADAAVAAGGAGEDEMDASAETAGECDLLVWDYHGPELSVQFVLDYLRTGGGCTWLAGTCEDREI